MISAHIIDGQALLNELKEVSICRDAFDEAGIEFEIGDATGPTFAAGLLIGVRLERKRNERAAVDEDTPTTERMP